MISSVIGTIIVVLVYVCLAIIVFSPTIFAGWFYVVSVRISRRKAPVSTSLFTTFAINVLVALFLARLAFYQFVAKSVSENDALAQWSLGSAVQSEITNHSRRGRYYSEGPLRGPYKNAHGLELGKDVILQMRVTGEQGVSRDDSFEAYAVHVFGRHVYINTNDGKIRIEPDDSDKAKEIRSKLVRSVK